MLDELYKDHIIPADQHLQQCDLTLGIDTSNIPKTQSKYFCISTRNHLNINRALLIVFAFAEVGKTMTDEEAEKVKQANEEVRKQREAHAETVADKFAQFKKDFLGAPIRKAMKGCLDKKNANFKPCQIDYRQDERFWVFASNNDVRVIYEVNFSSEEDKALARIFLLEVASTKGVQNAPAIIYHDKQFPQEVTTKFPGAMQ